jgi:hypothetical protein
MSQKRVLETSQPETNEQDGTSRSVYGYLKMLLKSSGYGGEWQND